MDWRTPLAPRLIGGVGLLFFLVIGGELLYILFVSNPLGTVWVAGVVTSSPFALVLIYAGVRLQSSLISPKRYSRVGYWCFSGLCLFVAVNVVIMFTMPPDGGFELVSWGRWGATIGAGVGTAVGMVEARGIERAVEAERERVRADEAQAKKKLLTYLNATLRHEILNKANIITGHADFVVTQQDDSDVVDQMGTIIKHTEEMEGVIEDVRVLLRSTREEIKSEPVEITEMLTKEIATLQNTYESVVVETSMPEQATVPANKALRRAFANLLQNAVEHNNSDIPCVEVTVIRESEQVLVRIADNGPGISETEREKLFSREIRHDSNHGLGLTLVEIVINNYGGEIELTETGPSGTIFTATLPQVDDHSLDMPEATPQTTTPHE